MDFLPPDDPKVTLTMGTSSKVALVREGDAVNMDCSVAANPPANETGWLFDGEPLYSHGKNCSKNLEVSMAHSNNCRPLADPRSHPLIGLIGNWGKAKRGEEVIRALSDKMNSSTTRASSKNLAIPSSAHIRTLRDLLASRRRVLCLLGPCPPPAR